MADTTISAAFSNIRLSATPKFISPEIFNPASSEPAEFIKHYDRTSIANGWTEDLKITFFGSFLEGAANRWYEKFVYDNPDSTYKDITKEFTKEFDDGLGIRSLEQKLETKNQKMGETLKNYFYDLKTLAFDYDRNMDGRIFTKHFERGMAPKYRAKYQMLRPKNPSVTDLKEIIARIDSAVQLEDTIPTPINQPPTPSTSDQFTRSQNGPRHYQQPTFRPNPPRNYNPNFFRNYSRPRYTPNVNQTYSPNRNFHPSPQNRHMHYISNPRHSFSTPNATQSLQRPPFPSQNYRNNTTNCFSCGGMGSHMNTCRFFNRNQRQHLNSFRTP